MAQINIVLNTEDVKRLVVNELARKIHGDFDSGDVKFQVRSKQNYNDMNWENGEFQASITVDI